jgi:hypothetical protein
LGFAYLGGFDVFWDNLPAEVRKAQPQNQPSGDEQHHPLEKVGLANSIMIVPWCRKPNMIELARPSCQKIPTLGKPGSLLKL